MSSKDTESVEGVNSSSEAESIRSGEETESSEDEEVLNSATPTKSPGAQNREILLQNISRFANPQSIRTLGLTSSQYEFSVATARKDKLVAKRRVEELLAKKKRKKLIKKIDKEEAIARNLKKTNLKQFPI